MSRDPRTHPAPRARPLADLPLDGLLARDRELAREWAVALVHARPLERLAELPLHDLAADAPALCAQALRALGADSELDRLAAGEGAASAGRDALAGRSSLGALLGISDPPAAVAAAEALRGVLWEALLDELSQPGPRLLADLGDRLALVCSTILAAAFAASGEGPARDVELGDPGGSVEGDGRSPAPMAQGHRRAVIVDEQEGDAPSRRVAPRAPAAGPPAHAERTAPPWARLGPRVTPRPLPWDVPAGDGLRVRRSGRQSPEPLDEPA
jgi:hypothetical protein